MARRDNYRREKQQRENKRKKKQAEKLEKKRLKKLGTADADVPPAPAAGTPETDAVNP